MSNSRFLAAKAVNYILSGQSLSECLPNILTTINDSRDRALVQAIAYGVCRYYSRLNFILNKLLQKPLAAKENMVHALLLVGLYQLMEMKLPTHAAVAETVSATLPLKKTWAKGLVNAVLRSYLRQEKSLHIELTANLEATYAHPTWWITKIREAWPNHWQSILMENNIHPPFALRVNTSQISREVYLQTLQTSGYQATPISETKSGIIVEPAIAVSALPDFEKGHVSVQDGGAQLAAEQLLLQPALSVLDACAAPGGKFIHILQLEPQLTTCIALEKDEKRVSLIKENLARISSPLANKAQIICTDAANTKNWWDKKLFDRILLDAPCSASGVIRRHPDIKLLRRPEDINALAKEQMRLLTSLWPTLKPGGFLLYVTCSIFPEENFGIINEFLKNNADAKEEKLNVNWGLPCTIGRQILPGMNGMDGFYFAKMIKTY